MAKKPVPTKKPRAKGQGVAEAEEVDVVKSPGKLQKLFFWVIIPVLFALAIGLIVAEVTGTNVFEKAKSVLGQNSDSSDTPSTESVDSYNKQIVSLKAQLKEKDAVITKLQSDIDNKKTDTAKTDVEKKRLEAEIKKLQNAKDDKKTDITTVVKTYETMAPKKSAPILEAMSEKEAMKILKMLKPETLASILEKMQPTNAAKYTEKLSSKK